MLTNEEISAERGIYGKAKSYLAGEGVEYAGNGLEDYVLTPHLVYPVVCWHVSSGPAQQPHPCERFHRGWVSQQLAVRV